ncbi:GNAT family N-acetyltransferase [Spirillospora sp. NPDC048832]
MPNTPDAPTRITRYTIRHATPADLNWLNTNQEGWTVHEYYEWGKPHSLDKAWAVLIADDQQGNPLGWMYVVDAHDHLTPHLLYVNPEHRSQGVARALVKHLFASYDGMILLGSWDRELFDVWTKLGFSYVPSEGEQPGSYPYGDMIRPPVR